MEGVGFVEEQCFKLKVKEMRRMAIGRSELGRRRFVEEQCFKLEVKEL